MKKYPSRTVVMMLGWVTIQGTTLGCGRIGFNLLPPSDAEPPDVSVTPKSDAGSSCATGCDNEHGSAECVSGECLLSCVIGFSDCDLDPGNGCEAETATMADSCGTCGTQCTNDHGSSTCSDGLCSAVCDSDYGDCDADPSNGCETPLTSTTSCGSCESACTNDHGSTDCVSQACQPICESGYDNCDDDPDNGCETDLLNDPGHCGSCASDCGTSGQICVDGSCQASPCATGLSECDGDLTVTCETDITNDLNHCGFCNNACLASNGTPVCTDGSCEVGSCDSGYDNCDGEPSNGCEENLTNSVDHCSACNAACTNAHGSTRCESANCVPTCESGWDDCDGNPDNGCETSLTTASNCGMCGQSCPANGGTAVCNLGVCDTLCDLTGTFAIHAQVQASWAKTSGVESGNGWFDWWVGLDAVHSGNTADVQMRLCGGTIPELKVVLVNETTLYQYPDSLFDGGGLPTTSSTVTLGDSTPDSSLSLPTAVFLMGLSMSDPLNDPWPSSASSIPSGDRIDMDSDGNPGVTANFVNGGGYNYPRTSAQIIGYKRADSEYVAARTSLALNGALNSCTQSSGSAIFQHIQVRVLGCHRSDGNPCTSTEGDQLDSVSPVFSLSAGTYTMMKVSNGASCAVIRSALP